MFDNWTDPTDPASLEVIRRLEALADLRLTPSASATTRMRTSVMTAAHRRAALIAADATIGAADATFSAIAARRARQPRHEWRRPIAAVLAGTVTLGILAGTAYGAQPGGPFYGARMWTEMANLPAGLIARTQAEVARLEERLSEAQEASTAGDSHATEAALAAYTQILTEAAGASDGDPTAAAAIELSVTRHVAVLTVMAGMVPAPARPAVEKAISSSTLVLEDLGSPARTGNHDGSGGASGGSGGAGTSASHGVDAGDAAGESPDPSKAPKDSKPGKDALGKPAPTPKPAETPKPTATSKSSGTKGTDGHDQHDWRGAQPTPTPAPTPRGAP